MLTDLQKKKYTNHFNLRDTNKNGLVELADYEQYAQNVAQIVGWTTDSAEFKRIHAINMGVWQFFWKPADSDDDDKVTLDEHLGFMGMMVQRSTDPEVVAASNEHSAALFTAFDLDGDGKISVTDYKNFLQASNADADWADDVFAKLDSNGNGYISENEFAAHHRDFFSSNDPDAPGNWFYGPI